MHVIEFRESARAPRRRRAAARGFTLIELLITVALVGILAAIAYPSYTRYVQRARRAEACTVLLDAAAYMQRFYSANNRYDKALDGKTAVTLPQTQSPPQGTAAYTISFSVGPTQTSFTLQAVPTGPMANDACGTLTLDQTGRRGTIGATGTLTVADCWGGK